MKRSTILFIFTMAAACGPSTKQQGPTTGAGDACGGDACGGDACGGDACGGDACGGGGGGEAPDPATGVDWSQWQTWTKVNAETFTSKGHQKVMVDLYVPADHAAAYKKLKGEMPVGFAVVKAQYAGADAASGVEVLTAMAKMSAGYDDDNGNWYYAALSPDGKTAMNQGKLDMCVDCHAGSKADFVFGSPN